MAVSVTVALVGDPHRPVEHGVTGEELTRPWNDLPRVDLEVHEDEALGSVLDRAGARFGLDQTEWAGTFASPGFIAFFKGDEGGAAPLSTTVTLVDQEGRAWWNIRFRQVRYGDLIRAAEAGALDGDPYRVYLVLQLEIGNGLIADMPTLINLLDYAWRVIAGLGTGYAAWQGAQAIVDRLTRRTRDGAEAVAARGNEWAARQGDPATVRTFLAQRLRTTDEVAGLLGCDHDEAEAVLWAFGFVMNDDGLWEDEPDEESALLKGNFELLIHGYSRMRLSIILSERTKKFIKTGEAPEVEWGPEMQEPGGGLLQRLRTRVLRRGSSRSDL